VVVNNEILRPSAMRISCAYLVLLYSAFHGVFEVHSITTTPANWNGPVAVSSRLEQGTRRRSQRTESVGTLHRRSYFYVGGTYSELGLNGSALSSEQTYVEHLIPVSVKRKYPIVIIPGYGSL